MSEEKKQWLDVRRSALTDYYDLPAEKNEEAEDLFRKMEELADGCSDQGEFEKALLASSLQEEYVALITSCAPYVKKQDAEPDKLSSSATLATDRANTEAKIAAKRVLNEVLPIDGYDWSEPWWYAIPVVGPLLRKIAFTRNTIDQFDRMSGTGKKRKEDL